ncbi:YtoQ family protein [Halobacillus dabanensis]|uniref:YtoQ family protein n=1 Tax=Halobacillus dabanensis TaxID=240302 RepID=A0A1I3NP91_HALDA|nr:YtoQ family protein [Halobacillus dabanensis]
MELTVYLAGQIHDDWRHEVRKKADEKNLPLHFVSPQENHELSDDIGEKILGEQPNKMYRDDAASSINNFRTRVLLQKSDAVIAFFGESYKQWNTALDAGAAIQGGEALNPYKARVPCPPIKRTIEPGGCDSRNDRTSSRCSQLFISIIE